MTDADPRQHPDSPAGATTARLPAARGVLLPTLSRATAAAVLQALGRPGWLVPGPGADVVVLGDVPVVVALATMVDDHLAGRGAVVLWVHPAEELDDDPADDPDGEAAGVVVVHRGHVVSAHSWTAEGPIEVGDARVMAGSLGRPDAEVGLRALFRRPVEEARAALPQAADLLGLPAEALALLAAPEPPPATEYIPPVTGRRRLRAIRSAVDAVPEPGWVGPVRRWEFLLPGALAAWFAVRAAAAGLAGGTPDDVWGFGTLAAITSAGALWRARRGRRR